MTGRAPHRPKCPSTCQCLCHDTGGGDWEHPGQPCPGKAESKVVDLMAALEESVRKARHG